MSKLRYLTANLPDDVCCHLLTFIRALPMKSHVDKEAFFDQELPAVIQQHRMPSALALHLFLPELALLLMNSSASLYHCSILKCILSIVASTAKPPGQSHDNSSSLKDGTTMPLRILSEVLVRAFDSADRAIRWAAACVPFAIKVLNAWPICEHCLRVVVLHQVHVAYTLACSAPSAT